MDDAAPDNQALFEVVVFLNHFNDLRDPRQRGKVTYPLDEVLLLALLAVLAGAESFVEIARFGEKKLDLLRRFRPFRDGTPSHDHLGDIFAALDAEQFQRCFVAWVAALTGVPVGVVAIDGNAPENVTKLSRLADDLPSVSPEPLWEAAGKSIFFIHRGALWQAFVAEKRAAEVAKIPHREIEAMIPQSENLLWTLGDANSTVVVTHDAAGKQDGFYKIDLRNGESTRLLENGQCYTCARASHKFTVTKDGRRLLYFREDAQHDADLWTSDAGFLTARRLTDLNPQFDKYRLGSARLIEWLSDDGQPLRGTLLLPSDYQEGVRYPLIVWVYGGLLLSNDFDHFGLAAPGPFNMQLLATRGYAILLPDMPLGAGTQMLDMAKTVLPGVSKAIELGVADPSRLGIMGHSFGGYSTLSLIVQTSRFRAAIEASGLGDLVGGYGAMREDGTAFGISIEEQGPGSMGGTPWEVRDRYIANSPVYYFDRIKTPLLMLQGTEDPAVAAFLGDEVFVDLRRLGKEVEYVRYEGEGHSPLSWKYANQVDFCNRVIAWFDIHLKVPVKN